MFNAGIATADLTPYWGVELTGWGYYIERRWRDVHDRLRATALAVSDEQRQAILITLDLMVIDEPFADRTRQRITSATGIPPASILLTCSHSHNAPAAGGLLGVGECDPLYEDWASHQAATAAILAVESLQPAILTTASTMVTDLSFNRTRPCGEIDACLTAARMDRLDGSPLVVIANFGAHPTVMTEMRPWAVSRDVPGQVCDLLESRYEGAVAMYVQGACGDVNFARDFCTVQRCNEPALRLASAVIESLDRTAACIDPKVGSASRQAVLPTRRWTIDEVQYDRTEAQRRIVEHDVSGWREGFGRSMTNRPDDMVARHGGDEAKAVMAMCRFHLEWTERISRDLQTRQEQLLTEVQALQLGDLCIVANASEFFSPLALDVRRRSSSKKLMIACYSNGRIGYLPDEYDILARSYAGLQSPKYCNQFPFTAQSGPAMCEAMRQVIADATKSSGRAAELS